MNENRIALVTGGNRGIGLAIVKGLLQEGHRVLLGSRDPEAGRLAMEYLEDLAGNAEILLLDVSSKKSIKSAFSKVRDDYGKLDVLINNAGIIGTRHKPLKDGDIKEVKAVMKTNYFGPMRISTTFLPLLRKSDNARIINMSSGMGAIDDLFGGYSAYRLSKAGLNAQTILLSNDLRSDGIKVFAMCPGWVRTEMGGAEAHRTPDQGADTAIWLASAKDAETGKFYRDRKVIKW